MPQPIAPSPDQARRYSDHLASLKQAIAGDAADAQQAAANALGAHVQALSAANVDVARLFTVEDSAVIGEATRRGLAGLPTPYVDGLMQFAQSGHDASNMQRGIDQSANMRRSTEAILDAQEMNQAKAAFPSQGAHAIGIEQSPAAQLLYKVVSQADPVTVNIAFAEQIAGYKASGDPALEKIAQDFEAIAAARGDSQSRAAAFQSDPLVRDAMGILLHSPDLISRPTRKAISAAANAGGVKFSEQLDAVRGQIEDGLHNAGPALTEQINAFQPSDPAEADMAAALKKLMAGEQLSDAEMARLRGHAAAPTALAAGAAAAKELGATEIGALPGGLADAVNSYQAAEARYDRFADTNYQEMIALIDSGMPIEMVIMLVFMKLNERQEERLKLKMKQLAMAEAFERQMNSESASEQDRDRISTAMQKLKLPSSQVLMQELQMEQARSQKMLEALSSVMRVLQDMMATPIRNIR